MVPVPVPEKWDYETDVLIVGAGTAGLPAGWVAADAGMKACVLELLPYTAPSLSLINVGPAFAGTDVQKELGINDSPEEYYKDGVELGLGDPALWRVFADNQLETYYWCQKIGMGFGKDLFAPPGHRIKRGIWKKGSEMTRVLEKAAKEKGVDIKFSHRAIRLIAEPQTGRIIGLKARVKEKDEINMKARRAVILATGGFGRNPELVAEFGPTFIDWLPTMAHGHLGDGLKMALERGAATAHIGRAVSGSFAVDVYSKSGVMDFVGYAGGLFVNVEGKRFADEGMRVKFYGIVSEEGMKQPGHFWFGIIDEKMNKTTLRHVMMHKAKPVQANTLEELAKKVGINPAGLKATVEKYNHDLDTLGYDSEFDRRTQEGCEGKPIKLDTPPYYAYKCSGSTSSFKGGIKINPKMQVVNQYGEPIPALYAAGELTGGLWGNNSTYLPCTMVTVSMTFGRLAAKEAVKEPPYKG